MTGATERLERAVRGWLGGRPLVLGLCGAQGAGKSTVAAALRDRLTADGVRVAILSLDDLYLGTAARDRLARDVHPLLRTRGVPLTHDVAQGIAVIDAIRAGHAVALPRFDKARDEPEPVECWPMAPPAIDLLIFEGWCVGARAQSPAALVQPVNALEREQDAGGDWRRAVNIALANEYAALFGRIDRLVLLAAPGFEVVARWRAEQEETLRRRLAAAGRPIDGLMDDAAITRFVAHYERLTRWILEEMPDRADLVLPLDAMRRLSE